MNKYNDNNCKKNRKEKWKHTSRALAFKDETLIFEGRLWIVNRTPKKKNF
jgi:hypothetical protein